MMVINMKISNISIIQPNQQYTRLILKNNEVIELYCSCQEAVEKLCIDHGCTLQGCLKASSYLLQSSYKLPIFIASDNYGILVPTHSPYSKKCSWFSLDTLLIYNHRQISSIYHINLSYHIYAVMIQKGIALQQNILERK